MKIMFFSIFILAHSSIALIKINQLWDVRRQSLFFSYLALSTMFLVKLIAKVTEKKGEEEERDNSGFVSLEDRTKEREILCLIYPRLEAIVIGSCSLLKSCFEKEKEVDKILMLIMQKRELTNSRCCWGNMDVDVIEN